MGSPGLAESDRLCLCVPTWSEARVAATSGNVSLEPVHQSENQLPVDIKNAFAFKVQRRYNRNVADHCVAAPVGSRRLSGLLQIFRGPSAHLSSDPDFVDSKREMSPNRARHASHLGCERVW